MRRIASWSLGFYGSVPDTVKNLVDVCVYVQRPVHGDDELYSVADSEDNSMYGYHL